jgi:hypothetical protein
MLDDAFPSDENLLNENLADFKNKFRTEYQFDEYF